MSDESVIVPVLKPRDLIAKDLRTPKYRQRVERPKKGKGSFKRKNDETDELASRSLEDFDRDPQ